MAKYTDTDKRRMADLFIRGGMSMRQLEKMDMSPHRNTLNGWADAGEGNGGVPWSEAREQFEQEMKAIRRKAALDQSQQRIDIAAGNAQEMVVGAIQDLVAQLKVDGARSPSYSQLVELLRFNLKLQNREHLSVVFEIMEDFVHDIAEALSEHLTNPTERSVIMVALQEKLNEYQERLDPLLKLKDSN